MTKTAKTIKMIGRRLIERFIILGQYNQPGPEWPTGEGSVTVMSKVKIYHTESKRDIRDRIYTNSGQRGEHAEKTFVNNLDCEIRKRARGSIHEITAHLVQNFSPCWECVQAFVEFKNKHEGIKFSLTIEFANFYRHWEEANKNGLQMLSKNGIELKLLHGEHMWRAFLNDERLALDEKEKLELLDRARSEKRKTNEKDALKIYREFGLRNTTQPSGKRKAMKLDYLYCVVCIITPYDVGISCHYMYVFHQLYDHTCYCTL